MNWMYTIKEKLRDNDKAFVIDAVLALYIITTIKKGWILSNPNAIPVYIGSIIIGFFIFKNKDIPLTMMIASVVFLTLGSKYPKFPFIPVLFLSAKLVEYRLTGEILETISFIKRFIGPAASPPKTNSNGK